MKRKEAEQFLMEILDRIEILEYSEDAEEGIISLDELVRNIVGEYLKKVSSDKISDMKRFITGMLKVNRSG